MSLQHISFNQITEAELGSLVSQEVSESRTLEFKQDLQLATDEQKREFLSDVTALANTDGGDLFFGVRERDGVAAEIIGLRNFVPDDRIGQIENLLRDSVQPRLSGYQVKAVPLSNGNSILILRIPRSFAAPHMVFQKGVTRFCGRNAAGKYDLDVQEIRSAMLASETMGERLKNFRLDRINRLVSGISPVALASQDLIVLHLLPVISARPDIKFSTADLELVRESFWLQPIGSSISGVSFNIDGLLVSAAWEEPRNLGYVQLFRNGFLEAVGCKLASDEEGARIIGGGWEKDVISVLEGYLKAMDALELPPPYALSLGFLNVRGCRMYAGVRTVAGQPVDREHLLTDEVLIEAGSGESEKLLRPLFDQIWNGCGWPGSPSYDKDGEWHERG